MLKVANVGSCYVGIATWEVANVGNLLMWDDYTAASCFQHLTDKVAHVVLYILFLSL